MVLVSLSRTALWEPWREKVGREAPLSHRHPFKALGRWASGTWLTYLLFDHVKPFGGREGQLLYAVLLHHHVGAPLMPHLQVVAAWWTEGWGQEKRGKE